MNKFQIAIVCLIFVSPAVIMIISTIKFFINEHKEELQRMQMKKEEESSPTVEEAAQINPQWAKFLETHFYLRRSKIAGSMVRDVLKTEAARNIKCKTVDELDDHKKSLASLDINHWLNR